MGRVSSCAPGVKLWVGCQAVGRVFEFPTIYCAYIQHPTVGSHIGSQVGVRAGLKKASTTPFRAGLKTLKGNRTPLLRRLLAWEAEVDAEDREGVTPLFCAARADLAEAVEVLVEHGAEVNRVDHKRGRAPLHVAGAEAVRALLGVGANVDQAVGYI